MKLAVLILMALALAGCGEQPKPIVEVPVDPVKALDSEPVNPRKLNGELSDIFTLFSDYTDLQRDDMRRQILGTVVQWDLRVNEVSTPKNDVYVIATQGDTKLLAAVVYIIARDDNDRKKLLSLKTNDMISFKGRVSGIGRLSVEVNPAVLTYHKELATTSGQKQK